MSVTVGQTGRDEEFAAHREAMRALGPPIKGPTATGSDNRRLLRLTWTLAVTDFKLRFFGSALGYLWSLMQPLMLFGVLYTVFNFLLDFSGPEKYYPVALLSGIVMFSFISEATMGSIRALVLRESLIRKIEFPRVAVPLAQVLTAAMNFALSLLPVFVFLLAAGGRPRWTWLEIPLLLLVLCIWVSGLAMLLSAMFVRYRDVEPIWTVILQVLFYATPIFYTLSVVGDRTGKEWIANVLMINPFAAVLQQFRHAVIDPSHVNVVTALGGAERIVAPLFVVAVTFALGAYVFSRLAPKVAEEL